MYFRVNVRGEGFHSEPMLNIWKDFPGMEETVKMMKGKIDLSCFKTEKGYKPSYVDLVVKKEQLEEMQEFDKIKASLLKDSDLYFHQHLFDKAAPLLDQLLCFIKDDFYMYVKACVSHTFSKPPNLISGENYARVLTTKWKNNPSGYSLLGNNI